MPENTVTLKKGTWFQMRNSNGTFLGEILDYQQDEGNPDLYWFKCRLLFNYDQYELIDDDKLFSNRDFEAFNELVLHSPEAGEHLLNEHTAVVERRVREREELAPEGATPGLPHTAPLTPVREAIEQAAGIGPTPRHGRIRPTEELGRDRDDGQDLPESVPERDYLEGSFFNRETPRPDIETTHFKTPLGSGNMKSILKVYEAQPKDSWDAIDNMIEETGHLLLTYTKDNVRQEIIQQKLDYLLNHAWINIEINVLYQLKFNDQITKALYLGNYHWASLPNEANDIYGLNDRSFFIVVPEEMKDFTITEIQDNTLFLQIGSQVIPEINPEEISRLAENGSAEVYCSVEETRNTISKKDISENWEKALVYNYYIADTISDKLEIKDFDDVASITKLATTREDSVVLAALAA